MSKERLSWIFVIYARTPLQNALLCQGSKFRRQNGTLRTAFSDGCWRVHVNHELS